MKRTLSVFDPTVARCVKGHPLYVQVAISESVTNYDQGDDCALILIRDEDTGVSPERTVTVSCAEGCKVPREAESNMLFKLKNSEKP